MEPMSERRRWARLGQLSTMTAVDYRPDAQCILLTVPPETLAAFEAAQGDPALVAAIDLPAGEIPWRADTFMLVDTDTSDRRRFLADGGGHRDLPLPLMASLVTTFGHEGAVSVGRITELGMGNPTVSAAGVFDDTDEARDVVRKIASESITGISADLAVFKYDFEMLVGDEDVIQVGLDWEVMGGTITPFPAFAEAQITVELQAEPDAGEGDGDDDDDDEETDALTVAVFADLPLADRERTWDATAAEGTVRTMASSDGSGDPDTIDWDAYFRGFLYRDADDAESFGGYSLGFAEVDDDGALLAVPRGLFAVAGVLQGGRGGADIPEADQERIRGVVGQYYAAMADEFDDDTIVPPWEAAADRAAVTELRPALVAAVPLRPSADWFANPQFSRPTPPTLTDDGRYFGHATTWEQCHIGFTDRCVTAEPSQVAYANFLTGYVETANDDGPRATGIVSMFGGHADKSLDYLAAIRHYDDASTAVAQVAVGDDAFGMWFAGCVMPGVTDDEMTLLRALHPSGDWRPIGGHRELVALLAVNHPGFPPARVASASGDCGECVPDELRVAARYHNGELVALIAGAGAVDLARAVAERERPVSRADYRALTSRLDALEAGFARHDPTVSALDPLARAELRRRIS